MATLTKLLTRQLGNNGPQAPRLGLGLMNISGTYGLPGSDEDRLAFLDEVYKKGETFLDTGRLMPFENLIPFEYITNPILSHSRRIRRLRGVNWKMACGQP